MSCVRRHDDPPLGGARGFQTMIYLIQGYRYELNLRPIDRMRTQRENVGLLRCNSIASTQKNHASRTQPVF